MKIHIQRGLPYVTASLSYRGQELTLNDVVLDTGSAGTIFSAERVSEIDLVPEPHDVIYQVRGVGGAEFVFTKQLSRLTVGELQVDDFNIEVGAMEYGIDVEGIVGLDFLIEAHAVIDLAELEVYPATDGGNNET